MKNTPSQVTYQKEWKGERGTMYIFEVRFPNDDKKYGYLDKSKDDPDVKVGTEIEYEVTEKKNGAYVNYGIKLVKPKTGFSGGRPQAPKTKGQYLMESFNFHGSYVKDELIDAKTKPEEFAKKWIAVVDEMMKYVEKKATEYLGD